MFNFFKKHSKKKSSKNEQKFQQPSVGFVTVTGLTCIPVSKFEVNFGEELQSVDSKFKPSAMGGVESSTKKQDSNVRYKPTTEFRNSNEKYGERSAIVSADHESTTKEYNLQSSKFDEQVKSQSYVQIENHSRSRRNEQGGKTNNIKLDTNKSTGEQDGKLDMEKPMRESSSNKYDTKSMDILQNEPYREKTSMDRLFSTTGPSSPVSVESFQKTRRSANEEHKLAAAADTRQLRSSYSCPANQKVKSPDCTVNLANTHPTMFAEMESDLEATDIEDSIEDQSLINELVKSKIGDSKRKSETWSNSAHLHKEQEVLENMSHKETAMAANEHTSQGNKQTEPVDKVAGTVPTTGDTCVHTNEPKNYTANVKKVTNITATVDVDDEAASCEAECRNSVQIPEITITESSDSESEECDAETCEDSRFVRPLPIDLYDITEDDEPFSDASDMEFEDSMEDNKRNVVQHESKFQDQIKLLKCEIEAKETDNMQLRGKINDLQHDILNKTWGIERLNAELTSYQTEAECVRNKLLKVEDDLSKCKTKNSELNEELLKKLEYEKEAKKAGLLQTEIDQKQNKIKELEVSLENAIEEKQSLKLKLEDSETDKREKIKTLEIALDETLKQKQRLQNNFDQEFEKLRTVNSDREQQLQNDFEWKLREVELSCKKKLTDKDSSNEEKVNALRQQMNQEIEKLKEQLKEVEKIKSYEAEVSQLRSLTQEQQKSLQLATKSAEQLQTSERQLNEEVNRLRGSLEKERSHLATVQGIHSREIAEKDRKHGFRLEQQKNELNSQWEDKLRRETVRLKLDLEKTHKEEKRAISEEIRNKMEEQLKITNQTWEKKFLDSKKHVDDLEKKLTEKEDSYRKELIRIQTNSDRDMMELRRKLDKMDLFYQEQLEKKQVERERETESIKEEYEKKMQQNEQNWSQQITSTRATLELVKEQLQRETQDQLEALNKKYILQLDEQYDRLVKEKEEEINAIQERHENEMDELRSQLMEDLRIQKQHENELLQIIDQLKSQINDKIEIENKYEDDINRLNHNITELKDQIAAYENLKQEADVILKKRESKHAENLAEMKEHYENEIRQWQSKMLTSMTETEKERPDNPGAEPCSPNPSSSRSSRRKNRMKHRGSRNQHLNQQFSSSSL